MVLSRKVEGLDEVMTNKGNDGRDYPFKQFVKLFEDDGAGNYCATKDDAKEFGVNLKKALKIPENINIHRKLFFLAIFLLKQVLCRGKICW